MCLPHIKSQVSMRVETIFGYFKNCFQANTKCKFDITTKLNGIVQLSMIPWCSNYHICFTRKSPLLEVYWNKIIQNSSIVFMHKQNR